MSNKQTRDLIVERLHEHRRSGAPANMRKAFAEDPQRWKRCSARLEDLLLDWSKCAVNEETNALLIELAHASGLVGKRDAMFSGGMVNVTERRPALHIALRNRSGRPILVNGRDVMPEVNAVLARLRDFSDGLRSGALRGSTGQSFTDIVNIGIGGSDLGPAMATVALRPYHSGPRLHFVSNVDGAHIADTLSALDPAQTFFIVASKTFTTVETMTNAETARRWLVKELGETAVVGHFAAVSSALDRAADFGIAPEHTFGFWDWVGGRYSVWSAIGLPLMLAVGADHFDALLAGAHIMDEHFRTAPLAMNMPVILGLIGVWHRSICNHASRAIIPYDQRLSLLPAYLQQLDMESNGKRTTLDGVPSNLPTAPVVWGEPGTNGQHAFFQFLHQGADTVPVEFLLAANSHEANLPRHHDLLIANCLAQSEALMMGRTLGEATAALLKSGVPPAEAKRLAPHKVFPGNRPSLTLAYRLLDPRTLGMLLALYEHRTFVEGSVWEINSFDQWGVELGKELATTFLPAVEDRAASLDASPATQNLLSQLRTMQDFR
ncbi:MAG TPA: glucose-6-phosphate isomerase [Aestuariivirgaceae bacterium]|jgi:glucose-6-phosphate isomerase